MDKPVAIVTGSRRGIGKGIAAALGRMGYFIVLSATRPSAGDVVQEMQDSGVACEYIKCDVSDSCERKMLIDTVSGRYNRLDVLVNNAGVAPKVKKDILAVDEESYDYVVNTNARSMFFMAQLAANRMIAFQAENIQGYRPRIINISSVSAYAASLNRGEYCISKAAIAMTTSLFAARLGEYNIPVFEVRPGFILTDMMAPESRERFQTFIDNGITPIRRFGVPEDIGNAVAALCGGQLDFATGQVIDADGGYHVRVL
jgi:NAD(P)-dependent dehydrogenase (short-subunit alcohol dehydrogenase family)